MADENDLAVTVCYAPPPPAAPHWLHLRVARGTVLSEAVARSGLVELLPTAILAGCRTGIWGKLRPADTVLRDADRIELYRPLQADPKESRRRRAKEKAR